ncbi:pyridoxamine phosphate oxidase [Geosmithia morbida]|uniref:Pyridoxamine phosphate oxidase n=1 Tax=Geosmithia morbida TaxID=1094350 RepID=A0A9P4YV52_9HYPO|nr:pyridoxamine phosphate oxidase [Geosmithia morbida]KAF4123683.1 pyridoxamine phosphate oxidase [Geosmithia morbida]
MKLFPSIPPKLADWAKRQPVFFTGSAATHGRHINVSPKGLTSSHFAILSPTQVAYIDRTGSGCETIAHSYENGRLCIMFISFGDTPRILRLFCRSRVVEWDRQPEFGDLVRRIADGKRDAFDGARAVILCDVWEVQTSCGYGVPRVRKELYSASHHHDGHQSDEDAEHQDLDGPSELSVFEDRPTLDQWAGAKVESAKMLDYHNKNNVYSVDGLPGLRTARRDVGQRLWVYDVRAWLANVAAERNGLVTGFSLGLILCLVLSTLGFL